MLELRRWVGTGECGVCAGLPAGWLGSEEAGGPLAWRRVARGPAVTLAETAPLVWEIFHPEGEKAGLRPEVESHALFQRHSRAGALPRGDFQGVNCLGEVELAVRFGSERQSVFFEVLSTGAYSRPFRPDFSLVVFPAIHAEGCGPLEAEARAEKARQLAYLHFDAKYRVDQLPDIFGPDDESVFSEEEAAKSTNTYKRADLYKMHAYNDAIRRTVGSYVLYPGNGPGDARFSKYHEILPGVGAFSISPGHADGRREIGRFVADVLERQRDRFTQLARINYWTHDTVREEPTEYHAGGRASHAKPPKDSSVVLGFLREGDDPELYRTGGVFFCHAVEWENAGHLPPEERKPGVPTSLGFDPLRADWLAVFQKKMTAPWLGKVENVRIVTAAERAKELKRDVSAMKAAYYYRIQFGNSHEEPLRDVSRFVGPRPSQPVGCTLAELAKCKPVSEAPESATVA